VPARLGRAGVIEIVDPGLITAELHASRAAASEIARRVADAASGDQSSDADPRQAPLLRARDPAFESRVRTAARRPLARQGRLDQLESVVACPPRRRPA
jgi:hypothetical protein